MGKYSLCLVSKAWFLLCALGMILFHQQQQKIATHQLASFLFLFLFKNHRSFSASSSSLSLSFSFLFIFIWINNTHIFLLVFSFFFFSLLFLSLQHYKPLWNGTTKKIKTQKSAKTPKFLVGIKRQKYFSGYFFSRQTLVVAVKKFNSTK